MLILPEITGMSKLAHEDIHLNVTRLLLESARVADEDKALPRDLEELPVL